MKARKQERGGNKSAKQTQRQAPQPPSGPCLGLFGSTQDSTSCSNLRAFALPKIRSPHKEKGANANVKNFLAISMRNLSSSGKSRFSYQLLSNSSLAFIYILVFIYFYY